MMHYDEVDPLTGRTVARDREVIPIWEPAWTVIAHTPRLFDPIDFKTLTIYFEVAEVGIAPETEEPLFGAKEGYRYVLHRRTDGSRRYFWCPAQMICYTYTSAIVLCKVLSAKKNGKVIHPN